MTLLARTDRSVLGTWWWTIDRTLLGLVGLLTVIGLILVIAASPPVGMRMYGEPMHFIVRHVAFLVPATLLLLFASLLNPLGVLRLAAVMGVVFGLMLILTYVHGTEINGARRWLTLGPIRLQPSEFMKPALAVLVAAELARRPGLNGLPRALLYILPVLALLAKQPDMGMVVVTSGVFGAQLFIAGLPWILVGGCLGLAVLGLWQAYEQLPYFAQRVDSFLDPHTLGDQVEHALRAVAAGGLFGRGPGEGVTKFRLPDVHADFIFAAAAEEFGIIACLFLVALFAFIVGRALWRVVETPDRFIQLAASGLVVQFALQTIINMAVNLNLMPTKGMTLPFVSYGGSSFLALALGTGMLLALTRRGVRLESPR